MIKLSKKHILFLLLAFQVFNIDAQKLLENQMSDSLTAIAQNFASVGRVSVFSINANQREKTLVITATDRLSEIPMRPENVKRIYGMLKKMTAAKYPNYKIICITDKTPIEELIPNFYRNTQTDATRKFAVKTLANPLVQNLSRPYKISAGLAGRHIALWQSHGFYYNQVSNRWMWQRARLLQTVEDLYTQSYVLSFLTPMLENAGANVIIPRERDTQLNETIIDNDNSPFSEGRYRETNDLKTWKSGKPGFAHYKKYYLQGENPFLLGSYKFIPTITDSFETSHISWIPEIAEEGYYAVYVSYKTVPKSTSDARYTVFHKGGKTEFSVNQTINGGTWLYLGHFKFPKGRNNNYRVELSNLSNTQDRIVTADAVKIGGGMGNIARSPYKNEFDINSKELKNGQQNLIPIDTIKPYKSGYPRFTEGARYWLQWAGMPDSIYSRTEGKNDYGDDFQSRGYWLNYISGNSQIAPKRPGLGIPVDLALAFHTDAGITKNDTIVGTLGICSVTNSDGKVFFENGFSRMASRDLTDMIQTQITEDIRANFTTEWTRRGLWNKSYSESRVPEVPVMLLELLSHQNPADMQYGHDPQFRFTVSRAIYKAMLRYICDNNGQKYVVQPLPIAQFSLRFVARNKIELSWEPVRDILEPTANPTGYVVYTRTNEGGFDNGVYSAKNKIVMEVQTGKIYSFRIAALNEGGESFPSETLSAYRASNERKEVLIVNGFERISGPAKYKKNGSEIGFDNDADPGVPYISDISFTGKQYEFQRSKPWKTDDDPGFGASYGNYETMVIAGNTFDYPYLHGKALKEAGYSFVSTSVKALTQGKINPNSYRYINLILGKQKQTIIGNSKKQAEFKTFPLALQQTLNNYCRAGGNLLISGAFVGSDFFQNGYTKPEEKIFMENILKYRYNPTKASFGVKIKMVSSPFPQFHRAEFNLFDRPDRNMYYVESTDVIEPAGVGAVTICRYEGTNQSAGIAFAGSYKVCILGFPFETIKSEKERNKLMESVMLFFSSSQRN